MKRNTINILTQANVFTAIAVLYTIRTYLEIPSFVSRIIYFLFFLFSMYFFIKTVAEYYRYPLVKSLTVLVVLFEFYGFLLILSPPDQTWRRICVPYQFLNDFMESLLPIFSFVYFSMKNIINSKWVTVWTFVFIGAAIIKYMGMQAETMTAILSGEEDIRRNAGYVIVALIPCLPFFRNKILKYFLWVVTLMAIIFSVKRGAVVISTLAFLFFLWNEISGGRKQNKIWVFVLAGAALLVLVNYIQNLLESSDFLNARIEATLEGDSSERGTIYKNYFDFFYNESNTLKLLLGHGAYATLHYLGLMAHNDWLEIGIDMGLFSLGIYISFWVRLWKTAGKSKSRCPNEVYMSLLLFAVLYMGKSLFSMSIMALSIFSIVPFGYCIGQYYKAERK